MVDNFAIQAGKRQQKKVASVAFFLLPIAYGF